MTLASDSSPFHEKYYFDEDGEILGEVSFPVKYAATIRTVEIYHGFSLMSKENLIFKLSLRQALLRKRVITLALKDNFGFYSNQINIF